MGIFYLQNKDKWAAYLHKAEKSHRAKLGTGGELLAVMSDVSLLRAHFVDGAPPANVRISDHHQPLLAVLGANGLIGYLDAESTKAMRRFMKENADFGDFCPAVVLARESWSETYLLKLGFHGKEE